MEIRQLRYFVTVAQTRHFGQAAERLHMAQSPLSQAIRQLESQVGATLFNRTTRRVDLTPAGEAFLRDAERILASVETAKERVQRIGAGHSGVLRVGCTGLAAYRHLPQLARIAARELPDLILRFVPDLLTPAQEEALAEDRIDLAVLRPPLRRSGLASREIASEQLVLAVGQQHRLAGDALVALAELRDEDFVGFARPDSVVNAVVTQACLATGFLPRRSHEAAETAIVLTLVAAGLGVALLPESVLALRVEGVRYLAVADDAHVDLAMAWRRDDLNPALARLVEALEANGFVPPEPLDTPSGVVR
ncbi:LysR family transcriptional regulator [Pseudonocardia sp. DSM 110487]|uniref:LysR substrate-binding domain-containing protein n=1 Tax=Pseudonocardia sp. DSM 110487 TaxID=2865833 RepID=UPI001C69AD73|nr:LysR substrate-binding domain-containing protein [Pseudonocardia sp. DSM 110487]QYN33897.1 LysR family transcriptional regulator [Pseudonocardia sp. DSM 110487]